MAGADEEEAKAVELFLQEVQLLEMLMYRNKNQHGKTRYYRKLQVGDEMMMMMMMMMMVVVVDIALALI